jgi:hypothetical protein
MADMEVLKWAKEYAERNSITALAALTSYSRGAISVYLGEKYGAGVGGIESQLRPLMDRRLCPFLDRNIGSGDCSSRSGTPRPQQSGGDMEAHWLACLSCKHNKNGVKL